MRPVCAPGGARRVAHVQGVPLHVRAQVRVRIVMSMVAWPSSSWAALSATPRMTRWDAKLCRRSCQAELLGEVGAGTGPGDHRLHHVVGKALAAGAAVGPLEVPVGFAVRFRLCLRLGERYALQGVVEPKLAAR